MSVLFAMIRTSSERIRRLSSHLVVYDEIGKAIGHRDIQNVHEGGKQGLAHFTVLVRGAADLARAATAFLEYTRHASHGLPTSQAVLADALR